MHPDLREAGQVLARVAHRRHVGFHPGDQPGGPDRPGQGAGEQARAAVQIQRDVAGLRAQRGQHHLGQHAGGGRVNLPEPPGTDSPGPAGRVLGEPRPRVSASAPGRAGHRYGPLPRSGRDGHLDAAGARPAPARDVARTHERVRDQAVGDRDDLARAMLAQAGRPVRADREANPGAPAQPRRVAGQRLDRHLALDPGHAAQLLPDHLGLDRPLRGGAGVLQVAAAASVRARVRTGRLDPVRRRLEYLDGLGAGEPGRAAGHPGADPLAGQRVPDEHHLALVAGRAAPGHAPAAVGRFAYGQLEHIARGSAVRNCHGLRHADHYPGLAA